MINIAVLGYGTIGRVGGSQTNGTAFVRVGDRINMGMFDIREIRAIDYGDSRS